MKLVLWYTSEKGHVVYWIRQLDPLTLADFTTVGMGKFSLKTWWKLQKMMIALWLIGKSWSFEDSQELFKKEK